MEKRSRLVEWDELTVRLNGEKLTDLVRAEVLGRRQPVESIDLRFEEGRIVVDLVVRKIVAIPVRVECRKIDVRGDEVILRLSTLGAFGVPLPKILAWFAPESLRDGIRLDPSGPSVVVDISRLMPPFLNTRVAEIRMIKDGIEVELGSGAADLPQERTS